jgi:hypothetical protein
MKKTGLISAVLLATPFVAFAQTNLQGLISQAGMLLNALIPLLMAAALVVFFWGLIQYIRSSGEGEHSTGRNIMIAGIVSLFVMVSVWGLVRFLQSTLGINGEQPINPPSVPIYRSN